MFPLSNVIVSPRYLLYWSSTNTYSSSFRTSILYNEKTAHSVIHQPVQTANPGWTVHSETSRDLYTHDPSRFPHASPDLVKRSSNPENNNSVPVTPSENTTAPLVLPQTEKALAKDWKYEKGSIAASGIFSAVALAALILLTVMMVKKFRRRQRRKREGDNDPLEEARRRRESLMFCKNTSARSYMVEEQNDGQVVRVFCTSRNRPHPSIVDAPAQKIKSAAMTIKTGASRHFGVLGDADSGRSSSIAKQIVVVPSPLRSVVSRTAVPGPQDGPTLGTEIPHMPAAPADLRYPELDQDTTEAEVTPSQSFRMSLFRLPSIKPSNSPLFSF